MKNQDNDIHVAEVERALDLVTHVWETDNTVDVDDICKYIDDVCDIINRNTDFSEFLEATNLNGRERLN